MNPELWDQRFADPHFVYGKQPNAYFKQQLSQLAPGKILLLAEGEGRNAVYAASVQWQVDAVDWSIEGQKKAYDLAREAGVSLNYTVANILEFQPEPESYDAVALVFVHLPEEERKKLHTIAVNALKQNGTLILQAYAKEQLARQSGGPKDEDLLYSMADIIHDFIGLEFIDFTQEKSTLSEGTLHQGEADLICFTGRKNSETE